MIHRLECITGLAPNDAMARVRDAIFRAGGWIADHRLGNDDRAHVSFALPDGRFEDLCDGLAEIAVRVVKARGPDIVRGREIRCGLVVVFAAELEGRR